jgi:hypothetical protein
VTASTDPATSGRRLPAPLLVAVALTGVEALVLVVQGLALLPAMDSQRLTMGVTSSLFFVVYGGALGACAWQLHRLRSWARAPVVLAQLLQVMVGASFWGGATTPISVVVVAVGLATLVGIFHPSSLAALDEAG